MIFWRSSFLCLFFYKERVIFFQNSKKVFSDSPAKNELLSSKLENENSTWS